MPTNLIWDPLRQLSPPENSHVMASLDKEIFMRQRQNSKRLQLNCWGSGKPHREFYAC